MVAQATADPTIFAAFAVGLISFLSPCVLPLVPGYLSTISGVSYHDLGGRRAQVLGPAVIFCLAFTLMFVAFGMTATSVGSLLRDNRQTLNTIAGLAIIVLGLFFVATLFIDRLNRELRPQLLIERAGSGGPVIAGLAFAVAWTPCVGPTLASILAAASTSDTVGHGGLLLAFYSLGLAVPFLLTAVAFERATSAFARVRRHYRTIIVASGAIMIAVGVLIVTDRLYRLNVDAQRLLESIGLDTLYNL